MLSINLLFVLLKVLSCRKINTSTTSTKRSIGLHVKQALKTLMTPAIAEEHLITLRRVLNSRMTG